VGRGTPEVSVDLQETMRQLDELPVPEGVAPAIFAGLKDALHKLLVERGANKFTSAAPGSNRSKVVDLTVAADSAGARFHWSYRNEGDFNQDSIVNVSDLTPMGIHFGKDSTAPDWVTARVADGSENGKVELGDLVSIGANFLKRVTRYSLQQSGTPDPGGTWTQVADIPFAASSVPGGQLRQFDFLLDAASSAYYRVMPYDSTSAGKPSDPVQWGGIGQQGDWWMFGHDRQHTRRSPFTGPSTNSVKWSYLTGDVLRSSPAIGLDGSVYVGGRDTKFYVINADGSLKWAYTIGGVVYSSPAIGTDGTVYVGSDKLSAINPDGSLKWEYTTLSWNASSPAICVDGTVYEAGWNNKLNAVNPDGSLKWAYTTGDMMESSAALGADGTAYVGGLDDNLYAINPDGNLKWAYPTGADVHSSPSIGADGTVYVGSDDNSLYAINPDGSLKWTYVTAGIVYSSPALGTDGTVYVGSNDHKLHAINPDGSLQWAYTTGLNVRSSPAIGADGTVYVGSDDGKLYSINTDGSLKWACTTGNIVESSPAIGADGTVYVGSNDYKLYAVGPGGG
jgi:outer membrane protein assembly factor BamB